GRPGGWRGRTRRQSPRPLGPAARRRAHRGACVGEVGRMIAALRSLFNWKVRGFRVTEIIGVAVLAAVVVSVYFVKAQAARQSAQIAELQRDISTERQRVRLLAAEAARLEEPGRLEAL